MDMTIDLIADVASGMADDDAVNRLLSIIKDHHMKREIRFYCGRNRLVEDAEIESYFLEGCFKALLKVRVDIGNPLLYILWRGKRNVGTLFRQRLGKGVRMTCLSCGSEGRLFQRAGRPQCHKCGSQAVQTVQIIITERDLRQQDGESVTIPEPMPEQDLWFNRATYAIQIDELRGRLKGRSLELFDLLVVEGINADTSKNYLKDIARRWGVSAPSVACVLRRLRAEVIRYYEA